MLGREGDGEGACAGAVGAVFAVVEDGADEGEVLLFFVGCGGGFWLCGVAVGCVGIGVDLDFYVRMRATCWADLDG